MSALDKKLVDTEYLREGNWVKLVSVLKRQINEWATERLGRHGYADFKMVYMPVLMNISLTGTNNNDLACHARVTKQAMSKVAKELQKLGYIKAKADPRDKRSMIFTLTDRGKKLVLAARQGIKELADEYQAVVGRPQFERATETLKQLILYNDEKVLPKR